MEVDEWEQAAEEEEVEYEQTEVLELSSDSTERSDRYGTPIGCDEDWTIMKIDEVASDWPHEGDQSEMMMWRQTEREHITRMR